MIARLVPAGEAQDAYSLIVSGRCASVAISAKQIPAISTFIHLVCFSLAYSLFV